MLPMLNFSVLNLIVQPDNSAASRLRVYQSQIPFALIRSKHW
jgi:hypothetical protein